MKKILFICFWTLLLVSCDGEDETVDVTVMPGETTVGAGTFGCLVDGWIYAGGRYYDYEFYGLFPWDGVAYFVRFTSNIAKTKVGVWVKVREYEYITFTINNPKEGETCTFTDAKHILKPQDGKGDSKVRDLGGGIVEITRFDDAIISGRFGSNNGNPISHGRFDVKYLVKD